jgi:hypothetical protein
MALSTRFVFAADIEYKLKDLAIEKVNEQEQAKPLTIAFKDRVWAAPGIEQANAELAPPRAFDFKGPRQIWIESAHGCGRVMQSEGPQWLDEVAWPRTREMYYLGFSSVHDNRKEFTFGGAPLQR